MTPTKKTGTSNGSYGDSVTSVTSCTLSQLSSILDAVDILQSRYPGWRIQLYEVTLPSLGAKVCLRFSTPMSDHSGVYPS